MASASLSPGMLAALASPAGVAGKDAKSLLNTFCQKKLRKTIVKQDIVYNIQHFGNQMQATVTINCMDGIQFAGAVASNPKEAEQNAAEQALDAYQDEFASLPASSKSSGGNKQGVKRKAEVDPLLLQLDALAATGDAATGEEKPAAVPAFANNRARLHLAMAKLLKRAASKEDVVFETVNTVAGFQCTLSLPGLPDEWGTLAWAGEVAPRKKDAEENAAKYAVEAVEADPTFAEIINAPKVQHDGKGKGKSKGKDKGKDWGKGWGKQDFWRFCEMYGDFGKGWKGKGKGKGKGQGKFGRTKDDRERVSDIPVMGTVVDWKGSFGWVQASEAIDHPSAKARGGKLFLHLSDWKAATGSEAPPDVGASLAFKVYSDAAGLGCDDVTSM